MLRLLPLFFVCSVVAVSSCDCSTPPGEGEGEATGEGEGDVGEGEGDVGEGEGEGDVGEGEGDGGCVVDVDARDDGRACARTDHCPCGASCDLGRCVVDCVADADCAGGAACDDFGRCSLADDVNRVANAPVVVEGRLVADAGVHSVDGVGGSDIVVFRAVGGDVSRARVAAGGLFEVAIADNATTDPDDLTYAAEVDIADLAEGEAVVVVARQRLAAAGEFVDSLRAFDAAGNLATVSIRGPAPVAVAPVVEGAYRGSIVLTGRGLGTAPHTPEQGTFADVTAEVVVVDASTFRIALADPARVLTATGSLVGDLHKSGASGGTVDFDRFNVVVADDLYGRRSQIVGRPLTANWQDNGRGTFEFDVTIVYDGVVDGPATARPTSTWHLALSRTGDTAAPAASRRTVSLGSAESVEARTPFAVEQSVRAVLANTRSGATADADYAAAWILGDSGALNASNCTSDDSEGLMESLTAQTLIPAARRVGHAWVFNSNDPVGRKDALTADFGAAFANAMTNNALGSDDGTMTMDFFANARFGPGLTIPETVTVNGETLRHFIPCAYNNLVDLCDRAVAATGCRVVRGNTGLHFFGSFNTNGQRFSNTSPAVAVSGFCVLPDYSRKCAEQLVCERDSGGRLGVDQLDRSLTRIDDDSGDVQCTTTTNSLAQGFDRRAVPNTPGRPADDVLAACLADLDAFDDATTTASNPASTQMAQLAEVGFDDPASCLNPTRFLSVLAIAADSGRATTTHGAAPDLVNELITMRLVQRWAQVHTFIAAEALNQSPVLPGLDANFNGTLTTALTQSARGLRLLLHPRIATAIAGWSSVNLLATDPRRLLGPNPPRVEARWTAQRHVMAALEDLLAAQAALGSILVEERFRAGDTNAPVAVTDLLQIHGAADALFAGVAERAFDAGAPSWRPEFDSARQRFGASRQQTLLLMDSMRRGTNPLGIEEGDLPLYFDDVGSGEDGNFAAVSDYLLGDSFSATAPVPAIVNEARDAFEDARVSFLRESARTINVENATAEQDKRVSDAVCDLGAQLQDLCGIAAFAEEDPCLVYGSLPDDFSVAGCFFDAEDDACDNELRQAQATALEIQHRDEEAYFEFCVADRVRTFAAPVVGALTWVDTGDEPGWRSNLFELGGNAFNRAVPREVRLNAAVESAWATATGFDGVPVLDAADAFGVVEAYGSFGSFSVFEFGGGRFLNVKQGNVNSDGEVVVDGTVAAVLSDGPGYVLDGGRIAIADFNPCLNADHPDYAGFLPEVEFDGEGGVAWTCRPNDGFTGTTFTFTLPRPDAAALTRSGVSTEQLVAIKAECEAEFVTRMIPLSKNAPSRCYRGALGQQEFALRTLAIDVGIAQAEIEALDDEYDISMRSCAIQQAGNTELQTAMANHDDTLNKLSKKKADFESGAIAANAVADCLDSIAGANALDKLFPVAIGGSCAARGVAAGLDIAATQIGADIEEFERTAERAEAAIQSATDERVCFNEAELARVGSKAASLRLEQSLQQLAQGYLAFSETLQTAERDVAAAGADIDFGGVYATRVVGRDPWIDADVVRFARKMRLARRAAYVAVRGVEYEFQVSLAARGTVLKAEHPDDLDAALDSLREIKLRGTINGAQPAELAEVVSLRDDILQLGSSPTDPGQQGLSDVERLRLVLTDHRFQRFENGSFTGVEIPFRVAPLAVLGLGNPISASIASDSSCAERAFAFNATFVGDAARMFRGVVPQVNIEIRQKNSFFANRCDSDTAFQEAATRPARNLFAEAGLGAGAIAGALDADDFASARIQARLNVPPATFISDDFDDGESRELASRLLFGEYSLFIPATSLAAVAADGSVSGNGLRLNEVDDILLRIDYLSVAR